VLDLAEEWPTSSAIERLKIGDFLNNLLGSAMFFFCFFCSHDTC
jgi:hypothetical protein